MKVKKRPPLFKAYMWQDSFKTNHYPSWIMLAFEKPDSCLGAMRFRGDGGFYIKTNEDWVPISEGDYIVYTEAGICEIFDSYAFEREFEVVSES